jgi:FkbM family methyltransferase
MKKKLGYKNNLFRYLIVLFVKLLQRVLILNFNSIYSNEFFQQSNLVYKLIFDKRPIFFKTGHNRLFWRAKNFFSEEPLMIEWLKNFNSKDIFLDIGANVGTYTIPALSKKAKVYACELDPRNCSIIVENVFLNNLFDNFYLFPFGFSDLNSFQDIFYRDFSTGDALQSISRSSQIPSIDSNKKFISRQILFSLDYIFKEFKLEQPNKIKIDVDGNEKFVFEGGKSTILNCQELYYEDNNLEETNYILETIEKNNFVKINEYVSKNKPQSLIIRNILYKKK